MLVLQGLQYICGLQYTDVAYLYNELIVLKKDSNVSICKNIDIPHDIILGEISQMEKDKHWMFSLVDGMQKNQTEIK